MGKFTKMIDSMIQEFAEEIPTTLVQKLGELRKEMTTKYSGDPNSFTDKVSEAAKKIANDNNACMINIVLIPGADSTESGVTTCLKGIESNEVMEMLLTIPKIMHDIANRIDKEIPGFKQKLLLTMMMKEMKELKNPMSGIQDLLGSLGKSEA